MKKLLISHSATEMISYRHRAAVNRIASSEQPRGRSSRSFALCCGLIAAGCSLLIGVVGCGPASPDNATSLESRVSVGGPTLSKQGPSPRNDPFTQAATPVPLASGNGTGPASGRGTVPGGISLRTASVLSPEAGHPVEGLVVPELMAQKLNSPNVRVRLRALEAWAREAPPGAVDPFIMAFEDKDERVRARAQQLIEQDWARKAEAEKNGDRGER